MSVLDRITDSDRKAYYEGKISSKELAGKYGTKPSWIWQILPKPKDETPKKSAMPKTSKRALLHARKLYRLNLLRTMSVQDAAEAAHCTTRTMYRLKAANA